MVQALRDLLQYKQIIRGIDWIDSIVSSIVDHTNSISQIPVTEHVLKKYFFCLGEY